MWLQCCFVVWLLLVVAAAETNTAFDNVQFAVQFAPSTASRRARALAADLDASTFKLAAPFDDVYLFTFNQRRRSVQEVEAYLLDQNNDIIRFEQQVPLQRVKRAVPNFPDPLFKDQWHWVNAGSGRFHQGHDMNVAPVWARGINGTGVTVAVVDDGLDYTHPDFIKQFSAESSYDFNNQRSDPTPLSAFDNHGTRCAGEIAASINNMCGVGVAYGARIAGIKLIASNPTDSLEANALSFRNDINAVYSNSWGPPDTGADMEGPGWLTQRVFHNGVTSGRGGLGSIFMFAAGNGGKSGDDCNFDGYANSPYTLAIGAITESDSHASYSETCASLLAVTYSSGDGLGITTTDLISRGCTNEHSGTSAAAPIAAGIAALMLSIRPDLTWRDIMHLFVKTARKVNPTDASWATNGVGLAFSHYYGFGLLDADALIAASLEWSSVGNQQRVYTTGTLRPSNGQINKQDSNIYTVQIVDSYLLPTFVERVAFLVDITHPRAGSLEILIISPAGTIGKVPSRALDKSDKGYRSWSFTSISCFGESPIGTWTLKITDNNAAVAVGVLLSWELTIYGGSNSTLFESSSSNLEIEVLVPIGAAVVLFLLIALFILCRERCCKKQNQYHSVEFNESFDVQDDDGTEL